MYIKSERFPMLCLLSPASESAGKAKVVKRTRDDEEEELAELSGGHSAQAKRV